MLVKWTKGKLCKAATVYLAVSTPEISDRRSDIQEITVQATRLLTFDLKI